MDELVSAVGTVDRPAALKALITWVDLGVIKEESEHTFKLLEIAEKTGPGSKTVQRPSAVLVIVSGCG